MKFFRKFRERYLKEGKFTSYLRYALGEVILVVVGILIAVSINNWNESRIQKKNFKKVIRTIIQDIEGDLEEIHSIQSIYEKQEGLFTSSMEGTLTDSLILQSKMIKSLVTNYEPFNMETRGYKLLNALPNDMELMNDTLVLSVLDKYSYFSEINRLNSQLLTANIERNIVDVVNRFPWFSKVFLGEYPEEYVRYLKEDEIFRNKVGYQYALVYKNYLPILKKFEVEMKSISAQLDRKY